MPPTVCMSMKKVENRFQEKNLISRTEVIDMAPSVLHLFCLLISFSISFSFFSPWNSYIAVSELHVKIDYNILFVVKSLKIDYINYSSLDHNINIVTKVMEINQAKIIFSHAFYDKKKYCLFSGSL